MDAKTYADSVLAGSPYQDPKDRAYYALGMMQATLQLALDRLSPKDRAFLEKVMKP